VATVAITRSPLILVLVAPEADGHLGTQRFRPIHSDFDVTAHAVTSHGRHVRAVLEAQVSPRELGSSSHVHLAMAVFATALVVRLGVAAHAVGGGRKVHGVRVSGVADAFVARKTTNPLENVAAVFERVRRLSSNAEYACTRADRERESEQHRKPPLVHGISSVRATRRRPFHSKR
jgi:hypothetical protein